MNFETTITRKDLHTSDGVCDSYFARPTESGKFPGVILLMDAFGLREHLSQMAQTIASQGYLVLVPNLFYRQKRSPVVSLKFPLRPENMPEARKEIMPLIENHKMDESLRDIESFLDFLGNEKDFGGKIGLTGYCLGGSTAIRATAKYSDRIMATASFHAGNLATEKPDSPHLLLPKIKSKLYVAHADNDSSMPQEQIARFSEAVRKEAPQCQVELYKGAAHGFTMADLPAFDAVAYKRHWEKLFELFEVLF